VFGLRCGNIFCSATPKTHDAFLTISIPRAVCKFDLARVRKYYRRYTGTAHIMQGGKFIMRDTRNVNRAEAESSDFLKFMPLGIKI
jgi:hypothetical protein